MDLNLGDLTLLCGRNSAGKSTFVQPLLLMKQTYFSPVDPGPLGLAGPNIWFQRAEELFWHGKARKTDSSPEFSIETGFGLRSRTYRFSRSDRGRLSLHSVSFSVDGKPTISLRPDDKIDAKSIRQLSGRGDFAGFGLDDTVDHPVSRVACDVAIGDGPFRLSPSPSLARTLGPWLHVPGLRGNPEREYLAVGRPRGAWTGWFHDYTAGILREWQETGGNQNVAAVGEDLAALDLTWKVAIESRTDTHVAVKVGRTKSPRQGGAHDLVNIADVGFGVSQVLPVVVALRVAEAGQFVHVEQPELHLHPEAQFQMGRLLHRAAGRGVRVIAETHSIPLIRGVQTEHVQTADRRPVVHAHWFSRDPQGAATAETSSMRPDGSLPDWQEDLTIASMDADVRFLNASFGSASGD